MTPREVARSVANAPTYTLKEFWTLTITNLLTSVISILAIFNVSVVIDVTQVTPGLVLIASSMGQLVYFVRHKREKATKVTKGRKRK